MTRESKLARAIRVRDCGRCFADQPGRTKKATSLWRVTLAVDSVGRPTLIWWSRLEVQRLHQSGGQQTVYHSDGSLTLRPTGRTTRLQLNVPQADDPEYPVHHH